MRPHYNSGYISNSSTDKVSCNANSVDCLDLRPQNNSGLSRPTLANRSPVGVLFVEGGDNVTNTPGGVIDPLRQNTPRNTPYILPDLAIVVNDSPIEALDSSLTLRKTEELLIPMADTPRNDSPFGLKIRVGNRTTMKISR